MIHFVFSDKDTRYLFLKYDNDEDEKHLKELKETLNLIDPICYLPSWGKRTPVTQDFLWQYVQPTGATVYYCSIGLWQTIYKYFRDNNIAYDGLIENQHYFKIPLQHTFEQFVAIVDSWNLKYKPRPYQYAAAYKILQWRKSTSELATRAGKTLIAYMIFRYAMQYMGMKRILMIVPSVDLVKQAYNDFEEYAEFFKTECIWSGGKLVESANLTVGTFQSLINFLDRTSKKYNPHFFDGYDCVFVDETHRATANQIRTIISQPFMKDVKIAYGMTGTLPKEKSIERYCLHALLGANIQTIKPKDLMDAGYISNIHIEQIRLHYDKGRDWEEYQKDLYIKCAEYALSDYVNEKSKTGKTQHCKLDKPEFLIQYVKTLSNEVALKKMKCGDNKDLYISELKQLIGASSKTNSLVIEKMMIHFIDERIDYLCDKILQQCDKNTLILAHHTEYINHFAEIIKQRFSDRHVEVITGSIKSKERDRIKNLLKENDDCILIASYGVMSTGITLNNLCYGVLFESFKSNVVNMQSLGRGLGLSDIKDKYRVFDVIDCFDIKIPVESDKTDKDGNKKISYRQLTNKIYLQGLEKIKIYKRNNYEYNITTEHMVVNDTQSLFLTNIS